MPGENIPCENTPGEKTAQRRGTETYQKATPRYRPYLSSADRALGTEPFPCSSDREQSKAPNMAARLEDLQGAGGGDALDVDAVAPEAAEAPAPVKPLFTRLGLRQDRKALTEFGKGLVATASANAPGELVKELLESAESWEGVPKTPRTTTATDRKEFVMQRKLESIIAYAISVAEAESDAEAEERLIAVVALAKSAYADVNEGRRQHAAGRHAGTVLKRAREGPSLLTEDEEEKLKKARAAAPRRTFHAFRSPPANAQQHPAPSSRGSGSFRGRGRGRSFRGGGRGARTA